MELHKFFTYIPDQKQTLVYFHGEFIGSLYRQGKLWIGEGVCGKNRREVSECLLHKFLLNCNKSRSRKA